MTRCQQPVDMGSEVVELCRQPVELLHESRDVSAFWEQVPGCCLLNTL